MRIDDPWMWVPRHPQIQVDRVRSREWRLRTGLSEHRINRRASSTLWADMYARLGASMCSCASSLFRWRTPRFNGRLLPPVTHPVFEMRHRRPLNHPNDVHCDELVTEV